MEAEMQFIVDEDSLQTLFSAAGIQTAMAVPPCPLVVGDVIGYPAPTLVAVRVTSRWFRPATADKPGCWYVHIVQAPYPI